MPDHDESAAQPSLYRQTVDSFEEAARACRTSDDLADLLLNFGFIQLALSKALRDAVGAALFPGESFPRNALEDRLAGEVAEARTCPAQAASLLGHVLALAPLAGTPAVAIAEMLKDNSPGRVQVLQGRFVSAEGVSRCSARGDVA